jgi:hypothetical protein
MRSFRLVDLTISFAIEHLTIFSKLIHCIATCIANGAATINSGAAVPTSLTTTSLRVTSWSSGTFPIIRVFQFFSFFMFFNRCRFFIHPAPITHSQTSLTARPEVVVHTSTNQTMTTPARLDFFLVVCDACVAMYVVYYVINYVMHEYNWYYCLL